MNPFAGAGSAGEGRWSAIAVDQGQVCIVVFVALWLSGHVEVEKLLWVSTAGTFKHWTIADQYALLQAALAAGKGKLKKSNR
jgi:hypothetical protein